MRGKYLTPIQALRLGARAVRACFRDQLKAMRQEGLDRLGIVTLDQVNIRRNPNDNV